MSVVHKHAQPQYFTAHSLQNKFKLNYFGKKSVGIQECYAKPRGVFCVSYGAGNQAQVLTYMSKFPITELHPRTLKKSAVTALIYTEVSLA